MKKLCVMICLAFLLSFAPISSSMPSGIGSAGDNGCTCHGGENSGPNDASFDFSLEGIPNNFTLNTTYSITITMDNGSLTDNNANGYRMIANQGVIAAQTGDLDSHIMDSGATQTAEGQSTTVWNLTWTSPSEANGDVEFNSFVLLGSGDGDGAGLGRAHPALIVVRSSGVGSSFAWRPPSAIWEESTALACTQLAGCVR